MVKLITKDVLKNEFNEKLAKGKIKVKDAVEITSRALSGKRNLSNEEMFNLINAAQRIDRGIDLVLSGKYSSGYDVPFGKRGSIFSRIRKAKDISEVFGAGNSLLSNWQDLWDAIRIDLTIRKEAQPTIRQALYDEVINAAFTRTVTLQELYPYAIVFEENTGEGQAVRQGDTMGGQYETTTIQIFAAGFVFTLLAALFDRTFDEQRLNDGVTLAYNALKDHNAIYPILSANYAGFSNAQTAAAVLSGAGRQELLYLTLQDGIDDLSQRPDPVTGRNVGSMGLKLLCSEIDASHVMSTINGLPSQNQKSYPALSNISDVIAYEGETIRTRSGDITYAGVSAGTSYLIKPNRYMKIAIKKGLTLETDMRPDVKTLSQEERAWYFAEGYFNADGIEYYIQEITLPTW